MNNKTSSSLLVLLVDGTRTRATGIAATLRNAGADVIWLSNVKGADRVEGNRELPPSVGLALIHAGDEEWFSSRERPIHCGRVVYYGGSGGLDPRIPRTADRIWRPISLETPGITSEDASNLIAYATSGPAASTPALLRPTTAFPMLRTLGTLCVGYLAVRAAEESAKAQPPSGEIWKQLGWSSLADSDRRRLVDSPVGLLTHSDEVTDPNLWLDLITKTAGSRDRIQKALEREVYEAGPRGLKDGAPVKELVENLLQQPTVSPAPVVVENAFLTLASLEQW